MRGSSELETVAVLPVAPGAIAKVLLAALVLAALSLWTLWMPSIAPSMSWWQRAYASISFIAALAALLWFVSWSWDLMIRAALRQGRALYGSMIVFFGTVLFTPAATMFSLVAAIAWPIAAMSLAGYRLLRR